MCLKDRGNDLQVHAV